MGFFMDESAEPWASWGVFLLARPQKVSYKVSIIFSKLFALITLRPRGLRNSFAILATLKMFD